MKSLIWVTGRQPASKRLSTKFFFMGCSLTWNYSQGASSNCWENICCFFVICPLLLWCCWLGGRKGIACKKLEWWGTGMVICLERDADLHMAQPMPLPFTVSCFSKVQIGFTFLVPAHLGSPGKRPLNGCVCLWFVPSVCTCFQTVIPEYKLLQPWLQLLSVLVLPHYLVPTNMHRFNSHFSSEPTVVSLPAGFQNTYLLFLHFRKHISYVF